MSVLDCAVALYCNAATAIEINIGVYVNWINIAKLKKKEEKEKKNIITIYPNLELSTSRIKVLYLSRFFYLISHDIIYKTRTC